MRRIYHPYWKWEDFHAGMWRKATPTEEKELLPLAVNFTGDAKLYGSFMALVVEQWTFACEHNLTDTAMNRRAWIGHAACSMAIGCPEYLTRRAWWMLTQEQRDLADAEADRAIEKWELEHELTDERIKYMDTPKFYCAICWQEFDDIINHDAASSVQGKRINGHCKGDIRVANPATMRKAKTVLKAEGLALDSAEPIVLK